jgi:glycosyltransferase involved in cell wall biosynthesis
MREPLVSVVLPVFNRAALLRRAAASVLAQDYRKLELIVVDDGSTEALRPVVESLGDARVRYLRLPKNGGPAAARNAGIEAANGEFVAFQDSDDLWLQDKLRKQVTILQASGGDVGLVYTDLLRLSGRQALLRPGRPLVRKHGDMRDVALGDGMLFAYVQTWLIRKSVLQDLGGFDTAFRLWEDWDLCIRIAREYRIAHLPGVHVLSNRISDSITSDTRLWIPALRRIVEKHVAPDTPRSAGLARLFYTLARYEFLQGDTSAGWRALRRSLAARPSFKAFAMGGLALAGLHRRLLAGQRPATD